MTGQIRDDLSDFSFQKVNRLGSNLNFNAERGQNLSSHRMSNQFSNMEAHSTRSPVFEHKITQDSHSEISEEQVPVSEIRLFKLPPEEEPVAQDRRRRVSLGKNERPPAEELQMTLQKRLATMPSKKCK